MRISQEKEVVTTESNSKFPVFSSFFFFWREKTYLPLNQLTNNFVVEILNRSPLNPFFDVFVLFVLECKIDENLLEFLVDVIAKLWGFF